MRLADEADSSSHRLRHLLRGQYGGLRANQSKARRHGGDHLQRRRVVQQDILLHGELIVVLVLIVSHVRTYLFEKAG